MRKPDQSGPILKISRQWRYHAIFGIGMSKRSQQSPPKSFEEALRELEEILSEIENGNVGLEESLVKYERGNYLIQHCRGVLTAAEKQIEALAEGEGNPNEENPKSESMTKPE
jgi:exodeoxyribonuclease VII small subunit